MGSPISQLMVVKIPRFVVPFFSSTAPPGNQQWGFSQVIWLYSMRYHGTYGIINKHQQAGFKQWDTWIPLHFSTFSEIPQGGAPKIAKLVNIAQFSLWFMVDIPILSYT